MTILLSFALKSQFLTAGKYNDETKI